MTRPRGASEAFTRLLPQYARARLQPIIAPLIEILPLPTDVQMGATDAAIFTSANGVAYAPDGQGRTAYCVGPATTSVAETRGWIARMAGNTADDLVSELLQNPLDQRLFHFSGTHTRGDVARRLTSGGLSVSNIAVYDQAPVALSAEALDILAGDTPVLVPLFSPRTAGLFAAAVPSANCAVVIALSEAVAAELTPFVPTEMRVASTPTAKGMCEATLMALADISSG